MCLQLSICIIGSYACVFVRPDCLGIPRVLGAGSVGNMGQLDKSSAVAGEETPAIAQARKLSGVREVPCSKSLFAADHRPHSWRTEWTWKASELPTGTAGFQHEVERSKGGPSSDSTWLQDSQSTLGSHPWVPWSSSIRESSLLSRRPSNLPRTTFPSWGCLPRVLS